MTARLLALLASVVGALWCGPAAAQLRYTAVADVREVYNSHIFELERQEADWDLITELEPGIRLYYSQPRGLLSLSYRLQFQAFMRSVDPTADRPLLGYANSLYTGYGYLVSERTELAVSNRLLQGTENTTLGGMTVENGRPRMGRLVTGSRFVSDVVTLGLEHQITPDWSTRVVADGEVFYPYQIDESSGEGGPSPGYSTTAGNYYTREFETHAIAFGARGGAQFDERRLIGVPANVAAVLPDYWKTYLAAASASWRWQITEFVDALLGAGAELHMIERFDRTTAGMTLDPAVAPTGEAYIRYRRANQMSLYLGYAHHWTRRAEVGYTTSAETDEVELYAHYAIQDWYMDAGGAFLLLRPTSVEVGESLELTKALYAHAGAAYQLRPGVSIEAGYRVEALLDMPYDPRAHTRPVNPTRHLVTIGLSLAWPPPPPQEFRLNRRESEFEPLFLLGHAGDDFGPARRRENRIEGSMEERERELARRASAGENELPPGLGGPAGAPGAAPPGPAGSDPSQAQDAEQPPEDSAPSYEEYYVTWPR